MERLSSEEVLKKVAHIQQMLKRSEISLPNTQVTSASRGDLEEVFKVESVRRSLFPSGVLVRDSQSFGVEERFARFNIPLILADRLAAMFATRHDVTNALTSLSFGSAPESSVTRHILRYAIDYYGQADVHVIKGHVLQHLLLLPRSVRNSQTAKAVCVSLFIPDYIHDVILSDDVYSFLERLGVVRCKIEDELQSYGIISYNFQAKL